MAKYSTNSNKPVQISLAEGQGFALRRNSISEFRRKNREISEGAFGPWKAGEARGEFNRTRALIMRLEDAKEGFAEILKWHKAEAEKTSAKETASRKKMNEAQKAFDKNSDAVANALFAVSKLLAEHEKLRYESVESLLMYNKPLEALENAIRGGDEDAEVLEALRIGIIGNVKACGKTSYQSLSRIGIVAERMDGHRDGEAVDTKIPEPKGHAEPYFDWLSTVTHNHFDPEVISNREKIERKQQKFSQKIRKYGLGGQLILTHLAGHLEINIPALDSEIRSAAKDAADEKNGLSQKYDIQSLKRIGADVRKARKLGAGEDNVMIIMMIDQTEMCDRKVVMKLGKMLDCEAELYRNIRAIAGGVQKAQALENELISTYSEWAVDRKKMEIASHRYRKNLAKFRHIFGDKEMVGIVGLAKARAGILQYRAEKKNHLKNARKTQRGPFGEKPAMDCEEEKKPEKWAGYARAQEKNDADEKKPEAAIFHKMILTPDAKKDLKKMDSNSAKEMLEAAGEIPLESSDLMFIRDSISAYKATVSGNPGWRIAYLKNGENAIIWRMFTSHDDYEEWRAAIQYSQVSGKFALDLGGKEPRIVRFTNQSKYWAFKNSQK